MSLTVRKFSAQVRDSTTGEMIPAGLLSSDALGAINTAKNTAVAAVQAQGATTIASIPSDYTSLSNEVDDLKNAIDALNQVYDYKGSVATVADLPATGNTMMDVTQDTVNESNLYEGETATKANGVRTTGTLSFPIAVVTGISIVSTGYSAAADYPEGFTVSNCVPILVVQSDGLKRNGPAIVTAEEGYRTFATITQSGVQVYNNNPNLSGTGIVILVKIS